MNRTGYDRLIAENPDKYPARMGQHWNQSEIQELLTRVQQKKSVHEIANEHQRTKGSITAKLRQIAADYYYNNEYSIEKIQKYTGLSEDVILDAIERRKFKNYKNEEKQNVAEKTCTETTQINSDQSTLKDIAKSLCEIKELLKLLVEQRTTPPVKKIIKLKPKVQNTINHASEPVGNHPERL
jgi:transposase